METNFIVYLICLTSPVLIYGDQASERTENTVELTFYRLTKSIWDTKDMEVTFNAYVAMGANNYCNNNPSACGLTSAIVFKDVDIGKVDGYPIDKKKNLKQKFYINFPAGSVISNSSSTSYVLPKTAVIAIITSIRVDLHGAIGYWITWANTEYYGVPPPTKENSIIIPIACIVLILIIILAVAINIWNKKKEHAERIQKRIEQKKAQKKEKEESYNIKKEVEVPKVDKKVRRKKVVDGSKDQLYGDDQTWRAKRDVVTKNEIHRKTLGGASDTDSAIKIDDGKPNDLESMEEVGVRHQSLPPLKPEDESAVTETKKKKKKHKKHKSHKKANESQENIIQEDQLDSSTRTTEL